MGPTRRKNAYILITLNINILEMYELSIVICTSVSPDIWSTHVSNMQQNLKPVD